MSAGPDRNTRIVREFYEMAFNRQQPEEAVERYVGPFYRQHNPLAGDGPEPFIAYVRWLTGTHPALRVEFKRFVAEKDLVVLHSHMIPGPEDRGTAVIDIFRLDQDCKIVEHWDVLQEVPAGAQNTNTMF